MYIDIPQDSKNSLGRNDITFVHKKTRDKSVIDSILNETKYFQGYLYFDLSSNAFGSFADAQSKTYNGPILVTNRNLNRGDNETTLINHYGDNFCEKRIGYIKIEEPGSYTFSGQNDDRGAFTINGQTGYITWSGIKDYFTTIFNKPGYYPFEYYHGENAGGQIGEIYWITPSNPERVSIPYEVLFYKGDELNAYQ